MPSILVVGAGELGTAVLAALSSHPQRRRGSNDTNKLAVLRRAETLNSPSPATQAELARFTSTFGATSETGDFVDSPIPDLVAVFKRYDVVIQCGGFGKPPGTQLRVTQAVLEARVKRYFPWQFGVDYDAIGQGSQQELFDEQLAVRNMLRGQKATEWTIVSTGMFMSFLFRAAEGGVVDVEKRAVTALGSWGNRVTVTTPEDIGTMVAELVYEPREDTGVVFISGETVEYGELADLLDRLYASGGGDDGKWKRELFDQDYLKKRLEEEAEDLALKYMSVFAAGVGVSWDLETTVNYQRGIRLTRLEEFVRENRRSLGLGE
ncbi:hypothetical protein B0H63DRAFT_485159 [Podospora didyma]|uniref:NmrA-like domain-containing protein n=1 Tax=Podospora didyma TaxID=330526 RepID=A0AAE0N6F6_9PEZI|nr:hypothetical protein B0H63DRAFT_485159 [Podospora didyma]